MWYDDHEYSVSDYEDYRGCSYNELCEYCGDRPASWDGVYCGGYCHYRDTQVVPRKQEMIKRIVEIQAESRKIDPEWNILKSLSLKKLAPVQVLPVSEKPKKTFTESEHGEVKVGEKRKYCTPDFILF